MTDVQNSYTFTPEKVGKHAEAFGQSTSDGSEKSSAHCGQNVQYSASELLSKS